MAEWQVDILQKLFTKPKSSGAGSSIDLQDGFQDPSLTESGEVFTATRDLLYACPIMCSVAERRLSVSFASLQVLVVHPDCSVEERVLTAEALGLAPRDTSLFAPQPVGMSVQRATIVPRDNAVLVRTEIARAIIHPDKTILFPCRCALLQASPCGCAPLSTPGNDKCLSASEDLLLHTAGVCHPESLQQTVYALMLGHLQ